MAKKKQQPSKSKKKKNDQTLSDSTVQQIMQDLGCRGDTGLTERCCARIKEYVSSRLKDLPTGEEIELAGGIGAIVREESWGLLAAWQQKQDRAKNEDTEALLNQLIARHLLRRVADEEDETEAMRKALFMLIMATQDEAGVGATDAIQWLLTSFPPLTESTPPNKLYDLGDGALVGRAREHKGDKILLVIEKTFVDSLIGKT